MTRQILCLTGWGQKFDSLEFIFNDQIFDPFFVSSLDYSQFSSEQDFFSFVQSQVSEKNLQPEILVGWSLGGQLSVRLIEKKILQPKLLILIAPPFQLLKDERVHAGMAPATFKKFRDDFANAPDKTLKQFAILTAMNDKNAGEIARGLDVNEENFKQLVYWLDELSKISCFNVNFENMPPTLYFHGAGDMIVHVSQAEYFKERIKNFEKEIFTDCGHAPHLNDIERMRKIIKKKISEILT